MGNATSNRLSRHEKLDENNETHFEKIQARNSTTRTSRRKSRRRKKKDAKESRSVSKDEEREPEVAGARDPAIAAGPLRQQRIDIPLSFSRSQVRRRRRREQRTRGISSPRGLPSSHETLTLVKTGSYSASPEVSTEAPPSPAKKRLQKARATQMDPLSLETSPSDSSTRHVIHDYYVDMLDEAHRESRQASLSPSGIEDDVSFDEVSLTKGTVWASIERGAKVMCLAFSRYSAQVGAFNSTSSRLPLLLAVGSDNGSVVVVELYEDDPSSLVNRDIGTTLTNEDISISSINHVGPTTEMTRKEKVRSIDFSPDGKWLIVGGDDCTASLIALQYKTSTHDLTTLHKVELQAELEREDRIYSVQFNPNGSTLAIGGFDGMVAIAQLSETDGKTCLSLVQEIGRPGLVLSLDWKPDGTMLAVGGSDKRCSIVNTSSWSVVCEFQRTTSIPMVKWSPSGRKLAVGSHDGTVAVFDTTSNSMLAEVIRGHEQKLRETARRSVSSSCRVNTLCWSDDGGFLAIGGSDDKCAIVETTSFATVLQIKRPGHVNSVSWIETGPEGGRYLAIGGDDRAVVIHKTGTAMEDDEGISCSGSDFSSSTSSSYFSTGSVSQHEWVLRDDSFMDMDDTDQRAFPSPPSTDTGLAPLVTAVCFSRSKRTSPSDFVTLAGGDGTVTVFSTDHWGAVAKMTFTEAIDAMHFSYRSQFLALAGQNGIVYVVDVSTWKTIKEMNLSQSPIKTIRFSRHDERLAFGSSDGVLTLLDPRNNWKIVGEIDASDSPVLSIDWSSRNLAIGREDGSISVHEADKVYENFFVPQAEISRGLPVHSVSFGVRGRFLAVGDDSGKVAIFSAKGGWVLCHQIATSHPILSTKWTIGGKYLAFGGHHHELGVRVVDTIAWTSVKDVTKTLEKEGISSIDWSNDDKWLVLVSTNGASYIVDTETWRLAQTLSRAKQTQAVATSLG